METLKLRRVQQPSEVERLLESCIPSLEVLPDGAYPVRDERSVPRELRAILKSAAASGRSWACWTRGIHTWLFTCELSLALSRERRMPVLQISVYGDDGALESTGTWARNRGGAWLKCAE